MENNNYNYRDEIIEFPENYEEIANLALLNFEKNCKLDLNNLIKKGLNSEEIITNEINDKKDDNNIDNNIDNKKDEWADFDSDDDDNDKKDIEEQNNKFNNYQTFEDEEEENKNENENEDNIKCHNNTKIDENDKQIENNNIYSKIENHHIDDVDDKNIKKQKIVDENIIKLNIKEKNKNKTYKIDNKEIKEKMSKIKYTTPNWAINMNDEHFIKKVKNVLCNQK